MVVVNVLVETYRGFFLYFLTFFWKPADAEVLFEAPVRIETSILISSGYCSLESESVVVS